MVFGMRGVRAHVSNQCFRAHFHPADLLWLDIVLFEQILDRSERDGVDILTVPYEGHAVLPQADAVLARGDRVEGLQLGLRHEPPGEVGLHR